jgi:hypothetical protein
MIRDAAVDLIMKRLGNQTNTSLRQDIINEMVQAQESVLEADVFHPWFLVSEESSSATTIADERVLLPSDFLALWDYAGLYRYDASLEDPYIEMSRGDWDIIKGQFNYADKPTHWDISGNYLLMRPLADAAYPLRFWYIAKGSSLAGTYGETGGGNVENVWLKWASDWLIAETGMVIAEQYLQYTDPRVKVWEKAAAKGRQKLLVRNIEMAEAHKCRVMGEWYGT